MRIMVFALFVLAGLSAPAAASEWKPLIEPDDLVRLEGAALVVDIRPAPTFARGHVPDAVNAPYGLWRGPRENPGRRLSDGALTELLRSIGLTASRPVVVVHQGKSASGFGAAARVYWTLKSAGLKQIAILNGGVLGWRGAGHPLSSGVHRPKRSDIVVQQSDEWAIDEKGVQAVLDGRVKARLVDARPLGFFDGRNKHPAATASGTLRGALRLLHSSWFGGGGGVMNASPAAARKISANAGYDGQSADQETLVSFCNTGHWAATNWFALSEVAGIGNVKLYPESMVGWTRQGGEVVRGRQP